MIGIAAGSRDGPVPFACSFACFIVGRFETIRISSLHQRQREDRRHPRRRRHRRGRLQPDGTRGHRVHPRAAQRADRPARRRGRTRQVVAYAAEHQGPLYLRLTRQNLESVCPPDYQFRLGCWCCCARARTSPLIAAAAPCFNALEAAGAFVRGHLGGGDQRRSIKPLDEEMLGRSAPRQAAWSRSRTTRSPAASAAPWPSGSPRCGRPRQAHRHTTFGESGDPRSLYAKFGFDRQDRADGGEVPRALSFHDHQLRIYEIFEQSKAAFHDRFRDHAARIMKTYGFEIVAMWEARTERRTEFVYLLAWPNEAEKNAAWARSWLMRSGRRSSA